MRVLLVSSSYPADPETAVHGVYQRLGTFMRAFAGHRVEALFFVPPGTSTQAAARREARDRLASAWGVDLEVLLRPRQVVELNRWSAYASGMFDVTRQFRYRPTAGPEQIAAVRRRLALDPDAVFVHRLSGMAPLLRLPPARPPILFDLDDIEHVAFERETRQPPVGPGKRLQRLHLPALRRGERKAIERSAVTFVCSDADRDYLRELYDTDAVQTIPNSVPIPPSGDLAGGRREPPTVLFLGNYAHPPNRAAAERLASRIWPRVRDRVPAARLLLAGAGSEHLSVAEGPAAGVERPGFVMDLGELYRRTSLVCAPITTGGGTRVKLLEAAAWGRAMVATGIAAEGIGFEDGVHYMRRDTDAGIAEASAELLEHRERADALGAAAREFVRTRYSRESVIASIRTLLARHVGKS